METAEPSVDLFFCDMSSPAGLGRPQDIPAHWRILSQEEQARAGRYLFERDRHMYTACRATLRTLLAARTGLAPESLRFALGPNGKPLLAGTSLDFNVSHAGTWFACAIRNGEAPGPLGIDIEHVRPIDDIMEMAHSFFSPVEAARLAAIPAARRTQSFYECWTRKEAVIKATGEGLSRPLDSFEVSFGPGASPALLRLDFTTNPPWPMHTFTPAPGYIAALTSPAPLGEVHQHVL